MEKLKVKPNFKAHYRIPREILRQNTKFHKNRTNINDAIAKIVQRAHARPYLGPGKAPAPRKKTKIRNSGKTNS